jgi:hypothetical protein
LVWILKGKARLQSRALEIELGAEQKHQILWLDQDLHALVLDDFIGGLDFVGEIHGVGHAGAAALLDPDPQPRDRPTGRLDEFSRTCRSGFGQGQDCELRVGHKRLQNMCGSCHGSMMLI